MRARGRPALRPRRTVSPDVLWAAGLALLAWLHRLAFLHSNRDRAWPFTVFYEGDSRAFFVYARSLIEGRLYDHGIPFHPPGFPAFLAFVHTLLGAGAGAREIPHLAVKSALALVSSLAVGLLYLLVRPYLGHAAALVASALCVYHFGLYVIAVAPVSEGLYLTLLMSALLLWSRGLEHPLAAPGAVASTRPRTTAFVLGLLLGVMALVRAESAVVAALLVGTGLYGALRGRRERVAAALPWVVAAVGWAAAVAPWTARNALVLARFNAEKAGRLAEPLPTFVPLTIYGPLNLALANRPGADGTFSAAPITGGTGSDQLDFEDPRHLEYVLHGDEMAWRWIRSHPSDFAILAFVKWRLTADVLKLGWTQWNWPGGLTGERRPIDVFVPDSGVNAWWLAPLSAAGLAVCLARPGGARRWGVLVAAVSAVSLAVVALFFGYGRQGLVLLPFWLSVAAAGPVELARRLGVPGLTKRGWWAVGALALVLLAVEWWGAGTDRNFRASADSTLDGTHLNPDDTVRLEVLPR